MDILRLVSFYGVLVICFYVLLTDFEYLPHLLPHFIKVSRWGLIEGLFCCGCQSARAERFAAHLCVGNEYAETLGVVGIACRIIR